MMKLPRHKYLLTYRYSSIIFILTIGFLKKFLNEPENKRTREQMHQAARSGKQNIVEGVEHQASKSSEIHLLDVAKASLEELTEDYEDFLTIRRLAIWPKTDSRIQKFRQIGYRLSDVRNLSSLGELIEKPKLPGGPEEAANFLFTLCHQATFLLDKQVKATDKKVVEQGGYRENLAKRRLEFRRHRK